MLRITGVDPHEFFGFGGKTEVGSRLRFFKIKARGLIEDLGESGGGALEKMLLLGRDKVRFIEGRDREPAVRKRGVLEFFREPAYGGNGAGLMSCQVLIVCVIKIRGHDLP